MPIHKTSCPKCESEIEVEVEPYVPSRTYGDPNDCYPAEGGTVEPDNCPWCDNKLSQNEIYKEWEDERRDHISDYSEGAD